MVVVSFYKINDQLSIHRLVVQSRMEVQFNLEWRYNNIYSCGVILGTSKTQRIILPIDAK